MGFSINYGDVGFLGALLAGCLIAVALIVVFWLVKASKEAHDDVVENEESGDDLKW